MTKKILFVSVLLAITFAACKKQADDTTNNSYRISGDTVYVDNTSTLADKIHVASVTEEPFSKEIITAGTVQAIPTQFAYIAHPFAGRVTKSYIKIGQKVKVNTPLFEMISSDYITFQKEFFQAQSERDLALNDMKRKEDLIKNGVGSQRELEEAVNALKIAEKEYENAHAAIRIFQTNPDNMTLGDPLIIRSPIAGEVIENNVVTGQYLTEEADPVAVVADLSKVWVVAQVKEKDISFIHLEDAMDIHIAALPDHSIKGKIYHIDESIDEETRSVKVLSICDNIDRHLKLGMYTIIHFIDQPINSITIPEKALLQDEKNSFVFVEKAPNTYAKAVVEVEVSKDGKTVIAKGLNKGDRIISEGGYYLKK